jgi:hypothetical protein
MMPLPRSAGAMGLEFPYKLGTLCYIEVAKDGTVTWGVDEGTYERAVAGESRLFAVWPGEWSSHLFAIDDLDQFAGAFGIVHDEVRTGLADHVHQIRWRVSPYEEKPNGSYIHIDAWLDCGCHVRDLKAFAAQMRKQKGWDIATSGGWGSSGTDEGGWTYSIRVRRKSLS